jgi:hypothetical protein
VCLTSAKPRLLSPAPPPPQKSIVAFGRLKKEGGEFKAGLGYKERPCLRKSTISVIPGLLIWLRN